MRYMLEFRKRLLFAGNEHIGKDNIYMYELNLQNFAPDKVGM
jgi:hypothetical protein